MYDTIYVNGDSYTAKKNDQNVYSDFLQEIYSNCNIVNTSISGSNNTRIFRKSTEDLLYSTDKTFAIIGFSFINREEIWYNGDHMLGRLNKSNTADFPINSSLYNKLKFCTAGWYYKELDDNKNFNDQDIKNMLTNRHTNPTKDFVDFILNLVQFVGFLKSRKIKYLIFRAAEEGDGKGMNWPFIKSLNSWKYIQQDNNILDFDFSIPKFANDRNLPTTDTGHMYEDGHKEFAEFLKKYV